MSIIPIKDLENRSDKWNSPISEHLHQFSLPASIPSISPFSLPIQCLLLKCRFKLSFLGNPPFSGPSHPSSPPPSSLSLDRAYLHPPTEQKYLFFVSWISFWWRLTSFAVSKPRLQMGQCAGWVWDFLWRLSGLLVHGRR
jgi:hypothetical protein